MTGNELDRPLTAKQVADYLGIALGTVYNKIARNEIPYIKIGRSVRFRREAIDAWVEEQTAAAQGVA